MNPTTEKKPTIKVPILDLTRQYDAIKDDIHTAIQRVLASGRFILGPEVDAFEQEIAAFCGAKYAVGVASGTDALLLSLKALGVGQGDKVIIPSFTFFATAGVVHNVGATPVFADVDPKTYNIDPDYVRHILESARRGVFPTNSTNPTNSKNSRNSRNSTNPTVRAIIPVHLYGQMADMDELMAIAKEYNLYVVEDAAQAIGASYRSQPNDPHELNEPNKPSQRVKKAGTIGDLGCFSFFPTKNLGAYGDGGMVVTNDEVLADRMRMLRAHGSKPKYYHHIVGYNSRLDTLQAAILRVKLSHLPEWTAARQQVANRYDELLRSIKGIETPYRASDRTHIFHQYTIRIADGRRDALQAHLEDQGIGTLIYYPLPLHLQECFANLGYTEGRLPVSEQASHEVLSLPMFPELSEEEQDCVVGAIKTFFNGL